MNQNDSYNHYLFTKHKEIK